MKNKLIEFRSITIRIESDSFAFLTTAPLECLNMNSK